MIKEMIEYVKEKPIQVVLMDILFLICAFAFVYGILVFASIISEY